MKVRLFIFTLFCMGFAHAHALECADPGSSLLWRLEGKQSSVHLFGSIHLGAPDFYPLPEKVEAAFRQADYVVFELDPRTLLDPRTQATMLMAGRLPPGQRLDQLLSPQTMEQLQAILSSTGIPVETLMGLRPWFISTVLATLQYASLGYSPDHGIERYLVSQLEDNHEVLALETLDQQLAAFEYLDNEAFLAHGLAEFQQDDLAEDLVSAWRCADKNRLTSLMHDSFKTEDKEFAEIMAAAHAKLFSDRNLHMAKQIESYLNEGQGRYFVVVGSGHLLGENNILDLLSAKGHQAEALRLNLPE